MLANKTIVLGITGGIAAYKAADIASKLTQAGAKVDVVMTESATRFIAPLTLRSLTGRAVAVNMFELVSEFKIGHIELAEVADIVAIVPATANIIAKLAAGISDDMLTCTVLATKAPVIVAPAMNVNMFENPVTQDNLAKLKARGFTIVDPAYGRLASGKIGLGRLAETETIIGTIKQVLGSVATWLVSVSWLLPAAPRNPLTLSAILAIAPRARWVMPWLRQPVIEGQQYH